MNEITRKPNNDAVIDILVYTTYCTEYTNILRKTDRNDRDYGSSYNNKLSGLQHMTDSKYLLE